MLRIQITFPLSAVIVLAVLFIAPMASSYSVLSHEQIVDLTWKDHTVPALLTRFPGTTPEQLKEAHAYAYGGCTIQDMGYAYLLHKLVEHKFDHLTPDFASRF